jgi:YidC/Oxa1 family membrane protein insertase
MLHTIWNTILYRPLYNLLMLVVAFMPNADLGLAIIIVTILVKLVLFPLTQRSIESQMAMKALEPQLNAIKNSGADKNEQSKQTFALYKEKKINPFSSCLLILVQIPIIIALYQVFLHGLGPVTNVLPYSFVHLPEVFNFKFLGLLDLSKHSIVLALLAGVSQYLQGYLAQARTGKPTGEGMSGQFAKSMQVQMLYFLPILIAFIAYRLAGAVALYWITSNMVTVAQELYTARKMRKAQKA